MAVARLAAWTVVGIAFSATAFGEPPELTLPRLEFRVLDAGPDGPAVHQFRYRFEIHSAAEEDVVGRSVAVCQAVDGVFRIPEPLPPFGRLGVWIEVDDLDEGYRYGFGSFSYRLEDGAAAQPVPIRLRRGTVETGKVVDADTGKPIAGAEVAFEQTGRSDPWADWDRRMWYGPGGGMRWEEATRTDQNGRFRVVALNIVGLAARHPGYRDADDKEFRWVNPDDPRPRDLPGELVLKMHPLRLLRGRVLDRDGTPIGSARIGRTAEAGTSDAQGRFTVEVTSEEWRDRDHRWISLVAVDHRAILVPLSDFAFERETVFVLPLVPENSVTIAGDGAELEPVDLHASGLLPGRMTGVVYQPGARHKPLANAFGYIGPPRLRSNAAGEPDHLLRFMTDADGRFRLDHCPPGRYVLRLTRRPSTYRYPDASIWVRVEPERTTDLELFAPAPAEQLAIRFHVGDGSPAALYSGAGLDAQVVAKHRDPKTGNLPSIQDASKRHRAKPSDIFCHLEPLDDAITHWPATAARFEFSPWSLLENDPRHIVIPNITPGRWRLTLTAGFWSTARCEETLLTRDFTFTEGMPPLRIDLPAAGLAGTFEDHSQAMRDRSTIKAIPKSPELPTRTCEAGEFFRFVGLAPGTYSVRFEAAGCMPKQIDDVIVREGETTWMEHVVLEKTPRNEQQEPDPAGKGGAT